MADTSTEYPQIPAGRKSSDQYEDYAKAVRAQQAPRRAPEPVQERGPEKENNLSMFEAGRKIANRKRRQMGMLKEVSE